MKIPIIFIVLLSMSYSKEPVILVKFDSLQVDKSEFPLLMASTDKVDLNEENVILNGILETLSPTSPSKKPEPKSDSGLAGGIPDIPTLKIETPTIGFPGVPTIDIPRDSVQDSSTADSSKVQ